MWTRDIEELSGYDSEEQDIQMWLRNQNLALSGGDIDGSRIGAPVAEKHF